MTDKDKLDVLIRTSLLEEETPAPALQADLIQKIRYHKSGWGMPWWLPATIGGMQTVTFVAGAKLILPNSLFSYFAIPAGMCLILSAFVLSGLAHKKWMRRESEYLCG